MECELSVNTNQLVHFGRTGFGMYGKAVVHNGFKVKNVVTKRFRHFSRFVPATFCDSSS